MNTNIKPEKKVKGDEWMYVSRKKQKRKKNEDLKFVCLSVNRSLGGGGGCMRVIFLLLFSLPFDQFIAHAPDLYFGNLAISMNSTQHEKESD